MVSEESTRLNKFLALHLGVSRRQADDLIASGKITIDGAAATLGGRVGLNQLVKVDGKDVDTSSTELKYFLFHKPVGYVCSRRAQGDNPTIYAILPADMKNYRSVGRLDKDSSGLLLLTNDGDFAHRMTHPSFIKTKTYLVKLDHDLEPLHQQMIAEYGLNLPDGFSKLALTRLSDSNRMEWQVGMHEGRNRQIRRTFAAVGYDVVKLHRINFGMYALGDIKPGEWREVNI